MAGVLETLSHLDVLNRFEGVVSTFLNADWDGARRRDGLPGLLHELGACVTRQNSWTIYVPCNSGWRGIDIERLLRRYGVKIWDRAFTRDCITFRVKRRQANWAEYLLWRKGIPVCSRPFDPRNRIYGERYPPGSEPPTGGKRPNTGPGWLDELTSLFG
jgi:hypothetical protein